MKDKGQKQWYAVRTKLKAEFIAEKELLARGIETYLPKEKRLKLVQEKKLWFLAPLITNYIFVCIYESEKEIVKYTRGISNFLSFGDIVPIVPESQINGLKYLLEEEVDFERINEVFTIGDRVKILRKNMQGVEGKLVKYQGKNKVLIEISVLNAGFLINVPLKYLQKLAA